MDRFDDRFQDEFETRLKEQMRRVDAPAGFQGRVIDRIRARERSKLVQMRTWSMAIAAMLLLAMGLGWMQVQRHRQSEERAALATQQFDVALQVTARSMESVQRAIDRATNSDIEVGR